MHLSKIFALMWHVPHFSYIFWYDFFLFFVGTDQVEEHVRVLESLKCHNPQKMH